jgi:hypothetical protein
MPDVIDDERHAEICDALMSGLSACAVARQFGMREQEVLAVWDEEARRCFNAEELRKHVALEVRRVRAASLKYFNKGMELPDGELATNVYFKGVERLMYMLGANQPQQHAVHLINQAAPPESSTERLRAALDRLQNYCPRERELEDMDRRNESMTDEQAQELDRFREDREARRRAQHDAQRAKLLARANGE